MEESAARAGPLRVSRLSRTLAATATIMTGFWNNLEGVSLEGRYWLQQCLSATSIDAWYRTRLADGRRAAVRVLPGASLESDAQLEIWRAAIVFEHPHIVRMLDAGRTQAEGSHLIYAVCEFPDDFLAGVLEERALSASEAAEVLRAALSALEFLHRNGFVHGAVDPTHIMAFGDEIKLPSDSLRRPASQAPPPQEPTPYDAPELEDGMVSPAGDIWSLGIALHEVLTQQRPDLENDGDYRYLPEPFATVLRQCLRPDPRDRWTVNQIQEFLDPPVLEPPPVVPELAAPAVVAPKPAAPPLPRPAPPPSAATPSAAAPARSLAPPVRTPTAAAAELPEPPEPRARVPLLSRPFSMKWIPAVGLVAAVALSAVFFRHSSPAPAVPAAPPASSAPATAAPEGAPEATPKPNKPSRKTGAAGTWRVVAYTYNTRPAAEKKARSLNEKWAQWHAEVIAARGKHGPYYIVVGGRMTRDEAERLQQQAHKKGLPRDSVARNFE